MATSVREPAYVRTQSRSPAHDILSTLLSLYAPTVDDTGGCHRQGLGWLAAFAASQRSRHRSGCLGAVKCVEIAALRAGRDSFGAQLAC